MPKVVNAYSGNESIADSLKSLGDSMFGNESQRELIRQKAYALSRENENIPMLADALARGDSTAATRHGVLADRDPKNVSGYGQYYSVSKHGPDSEQGVRATMAVPGANYAHTILGERENIASRQNIARMQADKSAETQRAIAEREQQGRDDQFNRTPEMVEGADGKIVLMPRSQSMGLPSGENVKLANTVKLKDMETQRQNDQLRWTDEHTLVELAVPDLSHVIKVPKSAVADYQNRGYRVMPTLEQQKARVLEPGAGGRPGDNTMNLTPDQRTMVGLKTDSQSFVHPTLGLTGTSSDNGQTLTLPDGRRIPLNGSGFVPSPDKDALAEARSGVNTVPQPMAAPNPSNSQAAADAHTVAGLDATVQKHTNALVGAVPGLREAATAVGMPEIGPGYERARQAQDLRENATRTLLLGAPGRPSNYSQQMIQKLMPEQGGITNPATEAGRVGAIIQQLTTDYNDSQRAASDPAIPPADRAKLLTHMRQVQHVIGLWTTPVAKPAAAPGAPPAAPQAAVPTATDPKTGRKVYFRNGQWVGQ